MGLLAIAAAVFAGAGTVAQAAIIDDFDTVSQYVRVDLQTENDPDVDYSFEAVGNLFGSRELYVELGNNRSSIEIDVSGGIATDGSRPDSAPQLLANSIAHVTWDGVDSSADPTAINYSSWPGYDFSGSTAFEIDVLGQEYVQTKIQIEVWDIFGNNDIQDWTIPTNTGNIFSLAFNTFSGGILWDQVGAIRMHFLTDDVVIDAFRTNGTLAPNPVPVPAAAGLGFLGMGLIAAFRRKQGSKVA